MLRIATIGTSLISDNFLEALAASERAEYVGTYSRDADRAASFTHAHGGSTPFTSIADIAASDEVDAVYIGSPNALHAPQALELIAGGKHLLVEKPFGSNEREARTMFDAAEQAGVVVLEAMRPLHDPAFHQVADAVRAAGRLRRASIRFGRYSSRYYDVLSGRQSNIFDCRMASGALMDMGVYCVEPMVYLFGEPDELHAVCAILDEKTREVTGGAIDGAGSVLARYPGMVAEISYTKITNDELGVQFESETETIHLDSISLPSHLTIHHRGKVERGDAKSKTTETGGSTEEIELPAAENTMVHELEDFITAVENARAGAGALEAQAGPFGTVAQFRDITLASLRVMDEIRRQNGIVFPADA